MAHGGPRPRLPGYRAAMAAMVAVEKRKWAEPGPAHPRVAMRWTAEVLGEDGFGTWLYCPAGEPLNDSAGVVVRMPCAAVQLMPSDGWWTAWWWGMDRSVTVDICTPPAFVAGTWSYVDLEVDLVLRHDGTVLVVDEDEFDQAVRDYSIPDEIVRSVTAQTSRLVTLLGQPSSPIVSAGWSRLADSPPVPDQSPLSARSASPSDSGPR